MSEKNIAILIPYFRKWPEWIDLFLYSCEQNSDIDFIIFTDCDTTLRKAPNIHFYPITFNEYCREISRILNIEFCPINPYKLCDIRPFLGFIHEDILQKYDFWGFGDIDIVWGNIRDFYTDDLLNNYDVFSTHNDRLSGHLSILKNSKKYTNLCFRIKDWQIKLTDDKNYALDEADFSRLIFPESKYIGKFYRQIMMKYFGWKFAWEVYYSIFPIIHLILRFKHKRLYFKEQHTTPILNSDGRLYKYESDTWFYKEGKIFNDRNKRDYIYLHFMIFKKNNIQKEYYWKESFYSVSFNYNFANGVKIDKNGISIIELENHVKE